MSPEEQVSVRSGVRVPGNFLAEGGVFVTASVTSLQPLTTHVYESEAVVFHVRDLSEGDGARGDYVGDMAGVVRPMLDWSVSYESAERS